MTERSVPELRAVRVDAFGAGLSGRLLIAAVLAVTHHHVNCAGH